MYYYCIHNVFGTIKTKNEKRRQPGNKKKLIYDTMIYVSDIQYSKQILALP